MAGYKKGQETKQKIYTAAKKMFYHFGYKHSTIEKIAEEAGVPVGLVNYYFKKDEIIFEIYKEFCANIRKEITNQVGRKLENTLQAHLLFTRVFFAVILSNDKNKEMYKEIFTNELLDVGAEFMNETDFRRIVYDFKIDISDSIFHRLITAEYGARRALLLDRYDRLDSVRNKDLINFLATIAVRLAGVDIGVIMSNVRKSDALFNEMDLSTLKFLY
ncbi:MAG: TetR/AcrR family transcriptional regulator [Eubacteriaceae bacterium]|nr:TetR/AcrR family transcriptional regulator [Eubacteriaceae bacterium]MBQ1465449.1 TetR/AcrR family transcriptional regulator [Eubacteriaceae bacterium]MBR2780920.1 TetR/AcrR family transcriptional regulator [Eubacteriaceae bacterium]